MQIQQEVNEAAKAEGKPEISLINGSELARIQELIEADTWPDKWDGSEPVGDVLLPDVLSDGSIQHLLFGNIDSAEKR